MATSAIGRALADRGPPVAGRQTEETIALARRLQSLAKVRARLRTCVTPSALFAAAAELACEECGFDRAIVLVLDNGGEALTAASTPPLGISASERLRRWVQSHPVSLPQDSREMEIIRSADPDQCVPTEASSILGPALCLRQHLLVAIPRSGLPAAALLVDRRQHRPDLVDRALIELLASDVAAVLAILELQLRAKELGRRVQLLASRSDRAVKAILGPVWVHDSQDAG
jgi:GAF domain-containing protein